MMSTIAHKRIQPTLTGLTHQKKTIMHLALRFWYWKWHQAWNSTGMYKHIGLTRSDFSIVSTDCFIPQPLRNWYPQLAKKTGNIFLFTFASAHYGLWVTAGIPLFVIIHHHNSFLWYNTNQPAHACQPVCVFWGIIKDSISLIWWKCLNLMKFQLASILSI